MNDSDHTFDQESLNLLQDRLKRGIPKWEQEAFIEHVVPHLVETLRSCLHFEVIRPTRRATDPESTDVVSLRRRRLAG